MENRQVTDDILAEVGKIIIGKNMVIRKVLMAMLAGGNILLDDRPGVGKTTLAMAMAKVTGLEFKRVQFTPDVMPSDITGFTVYNSRDGEFQYMQGAVMTHILLADEINRTSPKTQSALLEVMEEKRVTVDGVTREVKKPFFVIATQNPFGTVGTSRLPESQMDRFMIRISMGYPSFEDEIRILKNKNDTALEALEVLAGPLEILQMQYAVKKIYVEQSMYEYIARIAEATRKSAKLDMGMSTRASLAVMNMAKADAFLNHRDYVLARDIQEVLADCVAHRLKLSGEVMNEEETPGAVLAEILGSIAVPSV